MDQNTSSCFPSSIGPYRVEKKIASGGMGEIYLVYDPACDRRVALKKIRSDRLKYPTLKDRFLREAKIASQMTHPSIIPIYAMHSEEDGIYYTMPFVEGQTLKQMLIKALEEEKTTSKLIHSGASIPALLRIFLSICQGIAYCHNRGVLHRDIKPENIIVGKYGETLILDWGLADFIEAPLKDLQKNIPGIEFIDLTRPGKIPGTLSYIAPERILGKTSSYASDIYALGVILYQVLTLRLPFRRMAGKGLKKQVEKEELIDPLERAPYRDIPLELSSIAKRCLHADPALRYQRVEEIIQEIESFLEGEGRWYLLPTVDTTNKLDWQFQENILLSQHTALTRSSDMMEWVTLMISKKGLAETFKMQTSITLGPEAKGVGFLFNIAEQQVRKGPIEDSLCLWIGSRHEPGCVLFRSNVQILLSPEIQLSFNTTYQIRIEKEDSHLRLFIDNTPALEYLCYLPFSGPHFGVMLKDEDVSIDPIEIFIRSPSIMVNCLKVPDSFLLAKQYTKAFVEYKKIATSFPGRFEEREAIFRGGITLIDEATHIHNRENKNALLQEALDEFSALRHTPSAPLEFLGKSLVYKASKDIEEETKCLDIALRKYSKHPLKFWIEEEVMFRLHEAAYTSRMSAYHFFLLALRHMPDHFSKPYHSILLHSLQRHWHPLPLLEKIEAPSFEEYTQSLSIQLAFWLVRPFSLIETIETNPSPILAGNALFCLCVLGLDSLAEENIHVLKNDEIRLSPLVALIQVKRKKITAKKALSILIERQDINAKRAIYLLIEGNPSLQNRDVLEHLSKKEPLFLPELFYFLAWQDRPAFLQMIKKPVPFVSDKWLHFFVACAIALETGKEKALQYLAENPSFFAFDTHFIQNEGALSKEKFHSLFFWEKVELLKQAALFSHCAGEEKEAKHYMNLLKREKKNVKRSIDSP